MSNRGPAASFTDVARQVAEQCLRLWQPGFPLTGSAPPEILWTAGSGQNTSGQSGRGVLTAGLPWLSRDCSDRWIGRRLIWWPRGIPEFRRIAMASSRLSRRLDQEHRWFDLLRTALIRVNSEQEAVSVVEGTAVAEIVSRAACILEKPTIRFRIGRAAGPLSLEEIVDWVSQRLSSADPGSFPTQRPAGRDVGESCEPVVLSPKGPSEDLVWPADVSPEFRVESPQPEHTRPAAGHIPEAVGGIPEAVGGGREHIGLPEAAIGIVGGVVPGIVPLTELPLADRLLFASASRVCVLLRRQGGHVAALVQHHTHDRSRAGSLVFVAEDPSGPSMSPAAAGQSTVVRWIVEATAPEDPGQAIPRGASRTGGAGWDNWPVTARLGDDARGISDRRSRDASNPLTQPAEWLLHWTRPRTGPWPNQSREDWLDELILGCPAADRSALACLLRIVGERQLRASAEGIRGAFPVISFTEVSLGEFRRRRVFRGHRHRFDFEPWGIAVRRHVLQRLGARPVIYGSDDDWKRLSAGERPYFQKAADDRSSTDNRAEREWRLGRDLSFEEIPEADMSLFVDTDAAAVTLSREVSCEVLIVPE